MKPVVVVAIEMGYGHLRPARSVCEGLGVGVLHADAAPLADAKEQRMWARLRKFYELTTRASQTRFLGSPLRRVVESLTHIPHLHPMRDLSAPTLPVRMLKHLARKGLGRSLVNHLKAQGATLFTTFYAPAIIADLHGFENIFCLVTDTDLHRIWVPAHPERSKITYFVPSPRTRRRLVSYGVSEDNIHVTGFPLPNALVGGEDLTILKRNLWGRLQRLDPKRIFFNAHRHELEHFLGDSMSSSTHGDPSESQSPRLTFAIGGAGAQVELVQQFLPGMWGVLSQKHLRLDLVAGVRPEVAAKLEAAVRQAKLEHLLGDTITIHSAPDFNSYVDNFNRLLATTDILWTKPSELTFYAALGIPLIMSWPVGVHERYNRRWIIENGAGLKQRDPTHASEWLWELVKDGVLAQAAWSGFMRLPKFGLYRILELLGHSQGSSKTRSPP